MIAPPEEGRGLPGRAGYRRRCGAAGTGVSIVGVARQQDEGPHFYKKPDGGYVRPIFRREGLRELALAVKMPSATVGGWSYGLALSVLEYVFGRVWLVRNVLDEPSDGFLSRALAIEGGHVTVMHRVRDLAELVVNLLPVKGVEAPLDQVASGAVESGYAELIVGRLLYTHHVPFRFIWPSGKLGEDFDLELTFPNGKIACGDTKNKLETKDFSEKGIRNALDHGRKQLPQAFPGVIFIKVPPQWHQSADVMSRIEIVCKEFFRSTQRIVAVEVFAAFVETRGDVVHDWLQGTEIRNEKHRFNPHENWRLLALPADPTRRTTEWLRLVDLFE